MHSKPIYEELERRVQELEQAESAWKEIAEALRECEARFRDLVEQSPMSIQILDLAGQTVQVNQAWELLWGLKLEDLKFYNILEDEQLKDLGLMVHVRKGFEGEASLMPPIEYDARQTLGKGDKRWVQARIFPVKDSEGKIRHVILIHEDVTETKENESRLLKSEKAFRDLFDSISDLIYTQDLNGRFIKVNRAMCTSFGYRRSEFLGRRASEFMKPEMAPLFETEYLAKLKKTGRYEGITSYFSKAGEKIYIDYRSTLVRPEDGDAFISGTGRDVTEWVVAQREIKRLQKQMLQSQKMKSLGLMAGGIAHDLNNILSGIVSYPELILMDLPENSPLRKPLKTIQTSGERAALIVSDLLTVARGVAAPKEVSNFNTLIEQYLESAECRRLRLMHPEIQIKTRLTKDLLNVNCSPVHIQKILMNLVSNACEAIDLYGTVTIKTDNCYLDEPLKGYSDIDSGEYVFLMVSDDGSGISSEDLERIFEPFYTKKILGRSGTGLGLAVVWNTVQDHAGYINVQSGDKGTVFELYFPVTREPVSADKIQFSLESLTGSGESILVVDDEADQRDIACGMIKRLGYGVCAVSGGEEAIDYLQNHRVDLMVLDMIMPKGINGRETYEAILKFRPGQKAIIASGYAKTEEVKRAQKLGCGKYLKKPYTLEKIALAIKEALKN